MQGRGLCSVGYPSFAKHSVPPPAGPWRQLAQHPPPLTHTHKGERCLKVRSPSPFGPPRAPRVPCGLTATASSSSTPVSSRLGVGSWRPLAMGGCRLLRRSSSSVWRGNCRFEVCVSACGAQALLARMLYGLVAVASGWTTGLPLSTRGTKQPDCERGGKEKKSCVLLPAGRRTAARSNPGMVGGPRADELS